MHGIRGKLAAVAVVGAVVTSAAVGQAVASAAERHDGGRTARTTSHWMEQLMPSNGDGSILRNGTAPAAQGTYTLSLRFTKVRYATKVFVEERDGADLGDVVTVHAGQHATVTLATHVPAGKQYNVIALQTGKHKGGYVVEGTVTETATR